VFYGQLWEALAQRDVESASGISRAAFLGRNKGRTMMQNFVFFLLPNPQVVVRCSNTVNQIARSPKVCKTLCFPKAHIIPLPPQKNLLSKNRRYCCIKRSSRGCLDRTRSISRFLLTFSTSFSVAYKICCRFLPINRSFEHSRFSRSVFVFAVVIFVFISFMSLAFTFVTAVLTSFVAFTIFIAI
jgi:hypothetical protein